LATKKLVLDQKLDGREPRRAVYFSDNGKQLIELDNSGRVVTRNVSDGEIVKTFTLIGDTKKYVLAQALSPDRKTLATSIESDVILWDVVTGKKKRTLEGQVYDSRTSLAFSGDGTRLVIGYPSSVKYWSLDEVPNPQIVRLPAKLDHGRATLSPDGKLAACGGAGEETSTVWHLATGKVVFEIRSADISQLAFSPDSKLLASVEYEQVRLWDIAKREATRTVPIKAHNCAASFSPAGRLLAIWTDTEITLLDIERGSTSRHALDPKEHVAGLAFSPNEKLLASVDFDGTLRLWEVEEPEKKRVVTTDAHVAFVAFLDDGHKLGWLSRDGLMVWDLVKNVRAPTASHTANQAGGQLAISPDGKTAAAGTSWKDYVLLVNLATGQPVATLRLRRDSLVRFVQFSKDGQSLSAATADKTRDITVYTWNIGKGANKSP
jgi:WD40 repeat protein